MKTDINFLQNTLSLQAPSKVAFTSRTIEFRAENTGDSRKVRISPTASQIRIVSPASGNYETGFVIEGANNRKQVLITNNGIDANELSHTRVFLDGEHGNMTLGGDGTDGDVMLRNGAGDPMVHISGGTDRDANMSQMVHSSAKLKMNATVGLYNFGGVFGGQMNIEDRTGKTRVNLNGANGTARLTDIRLDGPNGLTSLKQELADLRARIEELERA